MTDIKTQGDIITNITIENATKDTKNLDLKISDTITGLINISNLNSEINPEIKLNDNLQAPIKQSSLSK